MPVSGPSKAFILNVNLTLRKEMSESPVSVSVLCPNGIRTNGECQRKIESHGFIGRLVSMDPDRVVACALQGMFAEKTVIVSGFVNQCIAALGRHAPWPLVSSVVSSFYGKTASGRGVSGLHPTLDQDCRGRIVYGGSYEPIHRSLDAV